MKQLFFIALSLVFGALQRQPVIFDIPRLKGKSMTQIKKILGQPKYNVIPTNYQIQAGATGDAFFEKGDFTLEITYNPVNQKVNDFFISKAHAVSNYIELEIAGNILNSKDFFLSPVREKKHPSLFTGVTATPK
ncbi:hypothetical protein BEL04_08455 [Mucilaginibacter sp. PPCGB 2223]|uniref:hypothetical protein n=1 Tax=Mucilaginibacter sp. PPCGB 2223 TaxID=1886027 RepID=UPI0008250A95|nr:hypothetical protein [Mucilaginibacter sp. PPCGB 2223]OCX54279.1 hypothetical protein BEL04_08455 [Mucilaginibacter sp. PPCGB 2223]